MIDKLVMVDTNILVYAFDLTEKEKRRICKDIIKVGFEGEKNFVVSNQILGEFFTVITAKIDRPLKPEEAETVISGIIDSDNWTKTNYTHLTVKRAMGMNRQLKTRFWDALIAETMLENNIFEILTEDIEEFRKIPGITCKNPLKE